MGDFDFVARCRRADGYADAVFGGRSGWGRRRSLARSLGIYFAASGDCAGGQNRKRSGRAGGEDQILRLPSIRSDRDLLAFAESAGFKNADDRRAILPFLKYLDRQRGSMRIPLRVLQAASRYAASQKRDVSVADFLQEISVRLPDALQLKADEIRKALPCAN